MLLILYNTTIINNYQKERAQSSYYESLELVFPCVNKDWSHVIVKFLFDLGQ